MKEIKEAERVAIGKILKSLLMDDSGESTIQEVAEKLENVFVVILLFVSFFMLLSRIYT